MGLWPAAVVEETENADMGNRFGMSVVGVASVVEVRSGREDEGSFEPSSSSSASDAGGFVSTWARCSRQKAWNPPWRYPRVPVKFSPRNFLSSPKRFDVGGKPAESAS